MERSVPARLALKWMLRTLAVLAGVLGLLVVAALLVDANHFRGPLARFITARTGRQIRIEGDMKAHLLSLTPRLIAADVAIGNPPWMPPGQTAQIGELSLSVELLRLFTGSVVIHRLEVAKATLYLSRDAD